MRSQEFLSNAGKTGSKAQHVDRRILVVDDNRAVASSLESVLMLLGAQVHAVNDGVSALDSFDEFKPDTILLDLAMPHMDGYEVAERIRRKPRGEHVRLVAVSGQIREEDMPKTAQRGFDEHLVKPVSVEDLNRVLA